MSRRRSRSNAAPKRAPGIGCALNPGYSASHWYRAAALDPGYSASTYFTIRLRISGSGKRP